MSGRRDTPLRSPAPAGVHVQESIIGLINKVRGAKPAKDDDTGSDVAGV